VTPRQSPDSGAPGGGGSGPGPDHDAMEPFRPVRGRAVALGAAVVSLVVFGSVAILLPGAGASGAWTPADRVMFALIGVAIAWLLWRYAAIRAVPSTNGLFVRNLFRTRTVAWAEVEAVRFGGGEPWVTLDLKDADTVAVMAIQRADGPRSTSEAQRLATLVQRLG
jgi:hypothetical protein